MNHSAKKPARINSAQAGRLSLLVSRMANCCQDSMLRESERFGLLPSEMRCLMRFKDERYLTAKDLGQALDLAKSRISKIVDGLIAKGLLERWTDPRDGRYRLLNLTEKGKAKLGRIEEHIRDAHAMILARFKPEQRESVLHSLELLAAAMDQVKDDLYSNRYGSEQEPTPSGGRPEKNQGE